MQKKFYGTYILIGVLFILAGLAYLFFAQPWSKKNTDTSISFYQNFNQDSINKIEIIKAGKTLTLTKENDKWTETSNDSEKKDADSSLISTMFSKLNAIKINDPITETVDKQVLFNVDGSNVQVKMYNNNQTVANFYIGKYTPDYNGNYIRQDGENKIYRTNGLILSYFDKATFVKETTTNNVNQ